MDQCTAQADFNAPCTPSPTAYERSDQVHVQSGRHASPSPCSASSKQQPDQQQHAVAQHQAPALGELSGFAAVAHQPLASSLSASGSMASSRSSSGHHVRHGSLLSGHQPMLISPLASHCSSMHSSLDMDRMSSGATASSSGNSSGSCFSFSGYSSLSGSGSASAGSSSHLLLATVAAAAASGTQWVFPQHAGREVLAAYEFGAALGQGTFGVTSLVTCRRSAELRACKSISKRRIHSSQCVEDMMREVAVLQHLSGHPGVVELVGVYEDRRAVHLVMELCTGGELLDELARRGQFSEADAAAVMGGVLRALAYCHARGVIHRDIKLENFLLARPASAVCQHCGATPAQASPAAASKPPPLPPLPEQPLPALLQQPAPSPQHSSAPAGFQQGSGQPQAACSRCSLCGNCLAPQRTAPQVKVSDFGVSTFFTPGQTFTEVVGTPYYMAPEVLRRCYGPEADIWSAGVVAYLLISGQLPFYGATDREVIRAVLHGEVDLASGPWAAVSAECRHFVGLMLTRDPQLRPSAEQLLQHPWLATWGCGGAGVTQPASKA